MWLTCDVHAKMVKVLTLSKNMSIPSGQASLRVLSRDSIVL